MDESTSEWREREGAPSPEPRCLKRLFFKAAVFQMTTTTKKTVCRNQHGVWPKEATAAVAQKQVHSRSLYK
jgi:hypothetical protein